MTNLMFVAWLALRRGSCQVMQGKSRYAQVVFGMERQYMVRLALWYGMAWLVIGQASYGEVGTGEATHGKSYSLVSRASAGCDIVSLGLVSQGLHCGLILLGAVF